ncbi:MAG: GNAT family N-acetyltransferase [Defluviitaleaceae bacterium]|nr:GNAT family N-acetyltransferase [Defluviitaleaceae bacterium]
MITLETERLILRDYKESDLPDYHRILSDEKNMYYLYDIVTHSLEDARKSLLDAIAVNAAAKARRFAVTLKGCGTLIGAAGYEIPWTTPLGKIADPMGWFIRAEYQNKGYITEAVKRILDFAFMQDNCVRVVTGCFKDNLPTQKVMAKTGFRKEADKPAAMFLDGKMRDRLEFAINRDEYKQKI